MKYVLMIHSAEARFAEQSPEARAAVSDEYVAFTRALIATGRAGDRAPLEPTHTATSVRVRDGIRSVQDGPFAETREQLGGYYTIDAQSEDEAIAWAAKIPGARFGSVEVRAVQSMPTPAAAAQSGAPSTPALTNETHKQYLLLIYEREAGWEEMSPADREAAMRAHYQFARQVRESGHWIDGAPLTRTATARTVTSEREQRVVRDGPFAETREQLGGYYRVWARDLDEAIALAARIPSAAWGTIEVRPVFERAIVQG